MPLTSNIHLMIERKVALFVQDFEVEFFLLLLNYSPAAAFFFPPPVMNNTTQTEAVFIFKPQLLSALFSARSVQSEVKPSRDSFVLSFVEISN